MIDRFGRNSFHDLRLARTIIVLFGDGFDTHEIAQHLFVTEARVYNTLGKRAIQLDTAA